MVNLRNDILEFLNEGFSALGVILKLWFSINSFEVVPYSAILQLSSFIVKSLSCAFFSTYFTF
jgi:hypothetical protein